MNDLFLFIKETDICNFADDTTLHACGKDLDAISNKPELETKRVIQCSNVFIFLSKYKNIERKMSFDGKTIKASDAVKLIGITAYAKYLQSICHKANK